MRLLRLLRTAPCWLLFVAFLLSACESQTETSPEKGRTALQDCESSGVNGIDSPPLPDVASLDWEDLIIFQRDQTADDALPAGSECLMQKVRESAEHNLPSGGKLLEAEIRLAIKDAGEGRRRIYLVPTDGDKLCIIVTPDGPGQCGDPGVIYVGQFSDGTGFFVGAIPDEVRRLQIMGNNRPQPKEASVGENAVYAEYPPGSFPKTGWHLEVTMTDGTVYGHQ